MSFGVNRFFNLHSIGEIDPVQWNNTRQPMGENGKMIASGWRIWQNEFIRHRDKE